MRKSQMGLSELSFLGSLAIAAISLARDKHTFFSSHCSLDPFSIFPSLQIQYARESNNLLVQIPYILSHVLNSDPHFYPFTTSKCHSPLQINNTPFLQCALLRSNRRLSFLCCLSDLIAEVGGLGAFHVIFCSEIAEGIR